jgi:hypothetical protein
MNSFGSDTGAAGSTAIFCQLGVPFLTDQPGTAPLTISASCHCGGTRIEVDLAPTSATSCTCTYCTKSGGLWGYYRPDEVRIISEVWGGEYVPTGLNHHNFCARCGCTTYGVTPDWCVANIGANTVPEKTKIGLNIRLFDNLELLSIPIETVDRRNLW